MTSRMNMRPFQLLRVPTLACVVLACTSSVLLTACDGNDDGVIAVLDVHEVALTDFDILLPVSGELAAQKQVEVRNRIEQRAVIKEIVPEGTRKTSATPQRARELLRSKR